MFDIQHKSDWLLLYLFNLSHMGQAHLQPSNLSTDIPREETLTSTPTSGAHRRTSVNYNDLNDIFFSTKRTPGPRGLQQLPHVQHVNGYTLLMLRLSNSLHLMHIMYCFSPSNFLLCRIYMVQANTRPFICTPAIRPNLVRPRWGPSPPRLLAHFHPMGLQYSFL